jgi:peptide subunit release factor 1 (eRF1)
MSELDCFRCNGTFQSRTDGTADVLLECDECGEQLKESSVRRLSEDSGPIAELAGVVLEKA